MIDQKTNCSNCSHECEENDLFCSSCGQSRSDYNTNFLTLLKDYFDEAFGIDSKIKHTYRSFFIKPQFLTEEFLRGKRQHYVHPIRLYLICSIFFLFIFNHMVIDKHSFRIDIDKLLPKETQTTESKDSLNLNIETNKNVAIDTVSESKKDQGYYDRKREKRYTKIIEFIRENEVINDQKIKDSLGIDEWYKVKLIKQARYFYEEKGVTFFQTVIENIPLAIMLLVPLFALYLKLLYIRNKENLYIQHLIFSLHLHAFSLFIFGLIALLDAIPLSIIDTIITCFLLYWLVIILLMLKGFYKQKWSKTIFKLIIAGSFHAFMIFWVIIFEMLISLLIF